MNTVSFTKSGFETLQKELEGLKLSRKDAVADLKKAREMGDLSENGYYKAAKFKLNDIDRRIRFVTHLLKNASVPTVVVKDTVDIGCTVLLHDGAETKTYLLVGGYESNPQEGKLSVVSPVGRAMKGRKKGETFLFESPTGKKQFTIVDLSYII
jgi:transcription elongation factor GreA